MENNFNFDTETLLTSSLIVVVASLLAGIFAVYYLIQYFNQKQLFDLPDDDRKTHKIPTPSSGGLVFSIPVVAMMIYLFFIGQNSIYIFSSLLLIFVGFIDDRRDLSAKLKLVFQMLVACLAIVELGPVNIFGESMYWLNTITTVLFIAGFTNAFNLIDGSDGLAGTYALVVFVAFSTVFILQGQHLWALYTLSVCGMLVAFLKFNWRPAKIFMGDTGSLFLGFSIVFMGVKAVKGFEHTADNYWILLFGLLFLPVVDTIRVMGVRMAKGRSPLKADRSHLHHLLEKIGLKEHEIVLFFMITSFLFALETYFLVKMGARTITAVLSLILSASILLNGLIFIRLKQHKKRVEGYIKSLSLLAEENQLLFRKYKLKTHKS